MSIVESSLGEEDRAAYASQKRAVCAYIEGTQLPRIQEIHGYKKTQVYRMVGRCLESRPDGSMFGFYALIPRMTVASYRRRASFNSGSSIGSGGRARLFGQAALEAARI